MAAAGGQVASYLKQAKSAFTRSPLPKINLILGNEAADADSIISAICYGFLRHHSAGDSRKAFIPVASIDRADLHFRREVELLLRTINVNIEDIICIEDVPLKVLKDSGLLEITLTDHNCLDVNLSEYGPLVSEIVDHHRDTGAHDWVRGDKRQIAFDNSAGKVLAGSACTLIVEKFLQSDREALLRHDIATLLLGVVALDTINMNSEAGIGTERDAKALKILNLNEPVRPQNELFELMRGAKLDPTFWNELSAADVLRIDYKRFSSPNDGDAKIGGAIGIASAMQPIGDFLRKQAVSDAIEEAMVGQDLSLLVVMSFVHIPEPRREILFCTRDQQLLSDLLASLQAAEDTDNLSLVGIKTDQEILDFLLSDGDRASGAMRQGGSAPERVYGAVFHQQHVKASRKQVAPALVSFAEHYRPAPSTCFN